VTFIVKLLRTIQTKTYLRKKMQIWRFWSSDTLRCVGSWRCISLALLDSEDEGTTIVQTFGNCLSNDRA